MRPGSKTFAFWLVGISALMCACATSLPAQTVEGESAEVSSANVEEETDAAPSLPPNAKMSDEQRKIEKAKLYVGIVGLFLGGFVIMVAIITLMRWWRRKREQVQLGKKQPATEVIDAWSMHKLPEDTEKTDDFSAN